ncbi:ABC transporter substrate-binding protein [Ketogulonicigenium vulgare]|uniref:Iron(III) dicitrate ABC transporter permease protein n=1 Tax=Ketogulonicigenium vulgare (strain WSH-001) TaxID=759362 RepID=F9YB31_KETVW|nr:ABC transporter substrate-binding protein [Ketogulonicigenium vulgare]ADO44057.1 ABC-type Fe3+-hydroxamate transport system, periplasmic component [Ketogulonicigenium vulgare Y25]AEM42583.1 Iron(III) dicitrate ABC transporter permease protein [Ketogulonicigenium vulgare WSH-001]ALJ82613.1 iron ABC transporter permease [Ketogulonicigenium vulgare]ANW35366.1 iron ABC transporter permease [Ketogulonicigenium vulgare]AOZ53283.1 ABC-type Fe3+-hydroxamate transport system, periplasmic component [
MPSFTLTALCALAFACTAGVALAQDTRQVTDTKGEVTVPAQPQRVVVTDGDSILQPAVALGLPIVGASRPAFTGGFAQAIEALLPADLGYIGSTDEPNYEEVLLLDPDLILMSDDDVPDEDGMYARFSDIAPTVMIHQEQTLWKQALLDIATVTGRMAEAEALLARYEARLAEVRAVIGDAAITASVVRVRSDHVRYMAQDSSYIWDILKELGFQAPDTQEKSSDSAFVRVSLETLEVLDADFIMVLEDNGAMGDTGYTAQLKTLAAYQNLQGDLIYLPSAEYLFGNILTAFELLDLLEAHFKA